MYDYEEVRRRLKRNFHYFKQTCRVDDAGNIGHAWFRIFLSGAIAGKLIGLEEISERHAGIHFASVALGVIDMFTGDKTTQYEKSCLKGDFFNE